MSEQEKYCPIMTAGANWSVSKCIEEDCAWWDSKLERCAIVQISKLLKDIRDVTDYKLTKISNDLRWK